MKTVINLLKCTVVAILSFRCTFAEAQNKALQSTQAPTPGIEVVDCGKVWLWIDKNVLNKSSASLKASEQELQWIALKQLEGNECLKTEAKKGVSTTLLSSSESLLIGEITQGAPDDKVLVHLRELSAAQISAKSYQRVLDTYYRVAPLLKNSGAQLRFRKLKAWYDYLGLVTASAVATDKIDEGLKIAESELKSDKEIPIALQAQFSISIGDLLLSRVHVKDALKFYTLGISLDEKGDSIATALYWVTLDAYQRGDLVSARTNIKRLNALTTLAPENSFKNRAAVLDRFVASDKKVAPSSVLKGVDEASVQRVWKDFDLLSRR